MKKIKIVALLSAVITAILLYFFFSSLGQSGEEKSTTVVTASVNIPSNTPITDEMVTLTKLPDVAVLSGAITDKKLVLGKVFKTDILAGEQILTGKLISAGDSNNGTLAYSIEPGMRAITIAVDNTTGLAGMLKPQDKVDILSEFESTVPFTTLIAENITILSVDSVLSKEGKESSSTEGTSSYSTITLQVTPQQAMELSITEYSGHIRAVLRSPLDEKATNLPNVTLDSVKVN